MDTLGEGHGSGYGELSLHSRPPTPTQVWSSPSGAERLNTITREMGPSCRIVHVCRTSVQRGRTQGPAPDPCSKLPVPGPIPAITLASLVHVSNSDITTLAAKSGESPGCAGEVVDIKPEDTGGGRWTEGPESVTRYCPIFCLPWSTHSVSVALGPRQACYL